MAKIKHLFQARFCMSCVEIVKPRVCRDYYRREFVCICPNNFYANPHVIYVEEMKAKQDLFRKYRYGRFEWEEGIDDD